MKIRLATRGSALALAQAEIVRNSLEQLTDDRGRRIEVEIRTVKTEGDLDQKSGLVKIGGKGLFVRRIEEELVQGTADIAVHSGKDLPYKLHPGLMIAGVPKAADARDVLVTVKGKDIIPEKKHAKPIIGTGSPRRMAELRKLFPDAEFRENRGNVPTRLRKLREGQFDGIVLAKAGLDRLHADMSGLDVRIFQTREFLPAGCQGIIAVECRRDDKTVQKLLGKITDPETEQRFRIERYVFQRMKADCSMAVGVYAELDGDHLELTAMYDGKKETKAGAAADWEAISDEVCRKLAALT